MESLDERFPRSFSFCDKRRAAWISWVSLRGILANMIFVGLMGYLKGFIDVSGLAW